MKEVAVTNLRIQKHMVKSEHILLLPTVVRTQACLSFEIFSMHV